MTGHLFLNETKSDQIIDITGLTKEEVKRFIPVIDVNPTKSPFQGFQFFCYFFCIW